MRGRKGIRLFIILGLGIFFLYSPVYSEESRFIVASPRTSAIGGMHVGLTDQFSTIFNNPAGFQGVKSDVTVSELTFKITGPVSTLMLASQGGELSEILSELGSTTIGFGMLGPFSIGKIDNNMAWGIYNVIDTEVFIPDLTQDATVSAKFDLGGVYGYSFGLDFIDSNSQMNFGFLTKIFYRTEVGIAKSFTEIVSAFSDITSLFSPDTIPLDMGFGVGLDVGMKFILDDVFSLGLVVRNIYTPLFMFRYDSVSSLVSGGSPTFEYLVLDPDYSIGILYAPELILLNGLMKNIKIMLDYNDIFDFAFNSEEARHPLLHVGVGVEFTLFDILALRFGLYEGLPAAGAGLDLHMFKLNFAMFGAELSSQPGLMSVYNLMIGIEFSY